MDKEEIKMMNDAIDVKVAALKRAANTEKDETIREIRNKQVNAYANLQMKINTKGLFDEQALSEQSKKRT